MKQEYTHTRPFNEQPNIFGEFHRTDNVKVGGQASEIQDKHEMSVGNTRILSEHIFHFEMHMVLEN